MKHKYFYGEESKRFSYIIVPKELIINKEYKDLSTDAKFVYALLLDRCSLSVKNDWLDEFGRVYIIYTIEQLANTLNKATRTIGRVLNELERYDLIERKRQGLGKPNIIYVKDFMDSDEDLNSRSEDITLNNGKNKHSRKAKKSYQDKTILPGINTNYNNTDNIKPNYSFNKKLLGTFNNVILTDNDIKELKEKLKDKFDNYIERLSNYLQSTGKEYKDHKVTILTWYLKDQSKLDTNNSKKDVWSLEDYDKGEHL